MKSDRLTEEELRDKIENAILSTYEDSLRSGAGIYLSAYLDPNGDIYTSTEADSSTIPGRVWEGIDTRICCFEGHGSLLSELEYDERLELLTIGMDESEKQRLEHIDDDKEDWIKENFSELVEEAEDCCVEHEMDAFRETFDKWHGENVDDLVEWYNERNPETLADKLYQKVDSEHTDFLSNLQKQDTKTAIESAYEIVWKDNITQYLEYEDIDLTDKQFEALLSSSNTLDEIYWRFMKEDGIDSYDDLDFTLKDTADRLIAANEKERNAHMNTPLILHDIAAARALGESGLDDFRASRRENIACAEAIKAAYEHNRTFGDMAGVVYFDAGKAVDEVLNKGFPPERVGYVIASQVVRDQKDLDNPGLIDGRFSRKVKDWAIDTVSKQENFPFRSFEDCDVTSAMHHTLVDSLAEKFIDKQLELSAAKEEKKPEKANPAKKPSVLGAIEKLSSEQKAKDAERPAPQKDKSSEQTI